MRRDVNLSDYSLDAAPSVYFLNYFAPSLPRLLDNQFNKRSHKSVYKVVESKVKVI